MDNRIEDLIDIEERSSKLLLQTRLERYEYITYDFLKTHVDEKTLIHYLNRFENLNYEGRIKAMFAREKINFSEDKAVLHVLERDQRVLDNIEFNTDPELLDEYLQERVQVLEQIRQFSDDLLNGDLRGVTGRRITTLVNVGIGGSDLGGRMVCAALKHYALPGITVHFVSNVDSTDMDGVLRQIDPEETMFIIVSKTFGTQETLMNAELARKMMKKELGPENEGMVRFHFIAVTNNVSAAGKFGIENCIPMSGCVGGRYSLWSSVGLIIAAYIGFDNFLLLLRGASQVDNDFQTEAGMLNPPLVHAIIELFYSERGYTNKAILPYEAYLTELPSYLQQAEMESNGKTATRGGSPAPSTCMVIWGGVGTNSQHSFFQLLHQGTQPVLAEFLVGYSSVRNDDPHHLALFANCVAQSRALMLGARNSDPNRDFPGNRPSITIGYSQLTPQVLGALIAHYEHKIFLQGVYWDVNSYDQFGVELGKMLAKEIQGHLEESKADGGDFSTSYHLRKYCE